MALVHCDQTGTDVCAECPSGWTWNVTQCICEFCGSGHVAYVGPGFLGAYPVCPQPCTLQPLAQLPPPDVFGWDCSRSPTSPLANSHYQGNQNIFQLPKGSDGLCHPPAGCRNPVFQGFQQSSGCVGEWCEWSCLRPEFPTTWVAVDGVFPHFGHWCPPTPSCGYDANQCTPTSCPSGYSVDQPGARCSPNNCGAGTCFCLTSCSCVACTPPPCHAELHCVWNSTLCDWACDPPSCPSGQSWDWSACTCTGGGAHPWSLTPAGAGGYEEARTQSGAIQYLRWPYATPEGLPEFSVAATTPGAGETDDFARMVELHDENRMLVFARSGGSSPGIYWQRSDDCGSTWSNPVILIASASAPILAQLANGDLLVAAVKGTTLAAKIWDAGDATWGAEFTFKVPNGSGGLTNLVVDSGSTFHFAQAHEEPERLILLAVQSTNVVPYASSDYATWTAL